MYMGKQYKNEAGNKASRQVKCGTRQEMKMRDERLGNLCTEKLLYGAKTTNIVQLFSFWDYLKGNLLEDDKDRFYFRRASFNPLNYFAQRDNVPYENSHTAYHTTSVHGAQNSLTNIRNRHYPLLPGMSNMANMLLPGNPIGVIRRQNTSSRFASASWERHARIESINAFNNEATNLGLNVTWINNAPVFGAPNVGIFVSSFFITYTNPILGNYEVGVVSNMAGNIGMAARTTNIVKAVINYQQIGADQINAWILQLFPVMVAVPAINNGVININNFQGTAWAFSDFT